MGIILNTKEKESMLMKKFIIPLALGISIVALILGFTDIKDSANEVEESSIVYATTKIPNSLDKVTGLSKADENIICATSRGLVEMDDQGKVIPSLAKEIVEKEKGIEYEFTVKDDIFWSDGKPITAEDIRSFFKQLIKAEDAENIEALLDVYGAREFKNGTGTFEKGAAITTKNDKLNIRLNNKNEKFLIELTKPQYRVRECIQIWSDMKMSYNEISYSGEYYIKDFQDKEVQLEKNPNINSKAVESIKIIKDDNEELSMAAYEVGERDIIVNPPTSQLMILEEENKLYSYSSENGFYLSIGPGENELSLIDRKEIYRIIYDATETFDEENSKEVEAAEGSYFREDKKNLSKLQSRKVSLNEEVIWTKPNTITLVAVNGDESRAYCEFLQTWFKEKENINLKYSLMVDEVVDYIEIKSKYDMVLFNCSQDINNREELYKEMGGLLSAEESNYEDYSKIEENLFYAYRIVPVMFANNNIAISDKLSNISIDGNGNIDFKSITK
jgi:peptide/nickel transport system substrate-binding protein